jgi:hypothetical protein
MELDPYLYFMISASPFIAAGIVTIVFLVLRLRRRPPR